MLEVHPVDGSYQRRGKKDRRPGADLLHLVVVHWGAPVGGFHPLFLLTPKGARFPVRFFLQSPAEARALPRPPKGGALAAPGVPRARGSGAASPAPADKLREY